MNFAQFVANKDLDRAWIRERGIDLYVRRSILPGRGQFEIANMLAKRPGKGSLTRFLDMYEPQYSFFIENVLEPRLEAYLMRRGYHVHPGHTEWPRSFINGPKNSA